MKQGFEKNLREYSKLAKEQISTEDADELEKLQEAVDFQLGRGAMSQKVKKEKQKEVFDIQVEKQLVMERLYKNLHCLDDENCTSERPPQSQLVTYDEKKDNFLVQMSNGTQESATLGDILTDGDWGLVYYLDPKTTSRMAQKKFFVQEAKRELNDLLDEQIATNMRPGFDAGAEVGIHAQRQRIKEYVKIADSDSDRQKAGYLAETMVKNFFQSLYHNGLIDFRIIDADVYQDANQAIDFIIHIERHRRGVDVKADDKISDIAVQFTIRQKSGGGKLSRVNKVRTKLIKSGVVDDIVLIRFSMNNLLNSCNRWGEDNMPSGGPLQYISADVRSDLFRRVVGKLPGQRYALWEEIEPQLKFRE